MTETKCQKAIEQLNGCMYTVLSPGSKGPADLKANFGNFNIFAQIKGTRVKTKKENRCLKDEVDNLIELCNETIKETGIKTIPVLLYSQGKIIKMLDINENLLMRYDGKEWNNLKQEYLVTLKDFKTGDIEEFVLDEETVNLIIDRSNSEPYIDYNEKTITIIDPPQIINITCY